MSVGFGFSAGYFIAALQLVGTVIDALNDSGDSSTEYRSLIQQLYTLQSALLRVKNLELDDSQHAEVVALQQAAAQCQLTIDVFYEKIKKYQPSLRTEGSGSRVRDSWRKIKWAVCMKDDVVKFRAELMAHTESIDMMLTTVQMTATRIYDTNNENRYRTSAGRMQESYFGCMQRMTLILETVSTGVQQGKQLLEVTAKILQNNIQSFQILLNIQNFISQIPGQIERQQPVYFTDAIGRPSPFHLEFIMSAESLASVLQNNFKNIGSGAAKIRRGEFAIQDTITKRDVNLALPWEVCFSPGQKVVMSMVFNSTKAAARISCPKCNQNNGSDAIEDEDVECQNCKMVYRRTISQESFPEFISDAEEFTPTTDSSENNVPKQDLIGKRKNPHDEDEEMALFRRVRIKSSIVLPSERFRTPILGNDQTSEQSHHNSRSTRVKPIVNSNEETSAIYPKVPNAENWIEFKDVITRLYVNENRPLREVVEIMKLNYQFYATESQYKRQMRIWNLKWNSIRNLST